MMMIILRKHLQQKKLLSKSIHMQYLQLEKAVTPMQRGFCLYRIDGEVKSRNKDLFESGANDDVL